MHSNIQQKKIHVLIVSAILSDTHFPWFAPLECHERLCQMLLSRWPDALVTHIPMTDRVISYMTLYAGLQVRIIITCDS